MKIYRDWRDLLKTFEYSYCTTIGLTETKTEFRFFGTFKEGITCHENNLNRKKTHLFNMKKISQVELVLQRNDKNLSGSNENRNLRSTKSP